MKTRSTINRLLRPTGYEIVKTHGSHSAWKLAPGQVLDMDAIAERVTPGRKHVWISAAPKSGSTWFSLMVGWLLDWPTVRLTSGYDRKEHEIDLLPLLAYPDVNIFSPRQHCRASQPTLDFIAKFQVHPVIQLRDVFDSVVSLRDHLVGEDRRMSMAYVDDRFLEFDEERQFEFIVDMFIPWYLSFYTSWFTAAQSGQVRLMFINYEDLAADPEQTLKEFLAFIGEDRPQALIDQTLARAATKHTRKNKAVAGRGARLSQRNRDRIRELRKFYDHIDMSLVGL